MTDATQVKFLELQFSGEYHVSNLHIGLAFLSKFRIGNSADNFETTEEFCVLLLDDPSSATTTPAAQYKINISTVNAISYTLHLKSEIKQTNKNFHPPTSKEKTKHVLLSLPQ